MQKVSLCGGQRLRDRRQNLFSYIASDIYINTFRKIIRGNIFSWSLRSNKMGLRRRFGSRCERRACPGPFLATGLAVGRRRYLLLLLIGPPAPAVRVLHLRGNAGIGEKNIQVIGNRYNLRIRKLLKEKEHKFRCENSESQ